MTFQNDKKTFLAKLDKSKKGEIDEKIVSLLELINNKDDYYTTSSCSGRVYLHKGRGRKNETEWLKLSHNLIDEYFFKLDVTKLDDYKLDESRFIWLRLEPFILHVACKSLEAANELLEKAKKIYKKSCLLSVSNKIIVEIRGSEFIEMPFYEDGKLLFSGDIKWLRELVNSKLEKVWAGVEMFEKELKML
ncbi:MAG: tRNA wybutosine-synthesizing 3 family protein [Nanoarchaeota archaeon]|nr:hypothetical protein [Nanoarchaeota archaeon]MBU1631936.1 hypothetical protein [Nanoarchaeota archaeon]MBU1875676.1 hypothetical protein [Nanoarchaeota archaeon]